MREGIGYFLTLENYIRCNLWTLVLMLTFQAINTLRNAADRSKFTFETFGQTMLLEADPSILTPLTLSASSIATLGSNMPGFSGERESVRRISCNCLCSCIKLASNYTFRLLLLSAFDRWPLRSVWFWIKIVNFFLYLRNWFVLNSQRRMGTSGLVLR